MLQKSLMIHIHSPAITPSRKRARRSGGDGNDPLESSTVVKRKGKNLPVLCTLSELMNMPLDIFLEVMHIQNPVTLGWKADYHVV